MKRDITFLKNKIIAHRGYYDNIEIPENSIKAFKKAIKYNLVIELDVHILKDNSIIVFHDNTLRRMTSTNKALKNTTYNEIKDLCLKDTDEHIPLLSEVLKLINGKVPIIIELKNDVSGKVLADALIKELKDYRGVYALKSFNPLTMYYIKKHLPNAIRGQLVSHYNKKKLSFFNRLIYSNTIFNVLTKPDFISYKMSTKQKNRKNEKE